MATSGCHSIQRTIDKATGGPMRMNDEEAAARYLDIACQNKQRIDEWKKDIDKLNKLREQGNLNEKAYLRKIDEAEKAMAKLEERRSKELTDTQYEWPMTVRQLTVEMGAADLELVSARREYQRAGGFTKTVIADQKWPDPYPFKEGGEKSAEKASAIRSALRLPARNEGCKAGKRALTLERVKKLQYTKAAHG